jgi:UDP-glucuronate decarboxylase
MLELTNLHSLLKSDIKEICDLLGEENRKKMYGKNFLLVGGNGFIGKWLTEVLLELKNYGSAPKITVVDNFISSDRTTNNQHGYKLIEHDVSNPLNPLKITKKIDYIFALSSIASPQIYKKYPLETLNVGFHGLQNCLDLAREHNARLLAFSSSEVVGTADQIPTPETYVGAIPTRSDRSCYDVGKLMVETLTYTYCQQLNIDASIIRFFNLYGPGMNSKDFRVLPNFASRLVKNQSLQIYSSGNQTRTFCYGVNGILGCLLTLLNGKSGEIYNIGEPSPELSILDLVKQIEIALDRKIDYECIEYPQEYAKSEPLRRCPDISKAKKELGYFPQVSLQEGLRRFFTWAAENYV